MRDNVHGARPVLVVIAAAVACLGAAPAAGQTVTGQLVEEDAGTPIEGAFVRLFRLAEPPPDTALAAGPGREVDATFTGADGRYRLRGDDAGRYRLRVERIGYRTVRTAPFRLVRARTLRRDLSIAPQGIRLSGITVTGEQQCDVRPSEAREAGRLWEEVRKALAGALYTRRADLFNYTVRSFTYRLDDRLRRVEEVMESTESGLGVVPFRSLPVEHLSERGYVQRAGGEFDRFYYAPDAGVLLSETFRADHCFWVTRDPDDHPGWVGLGFRPVRERDVPDIEGVIWVDEQTAALQRLEFRYRDYGLDRLTSRAGGEVRYERVKGGPWIVSDWHVLMPRIERRHLRAADYVRPAEDVLAGYRKVGGRVLEARTLTGETVFRRDEEG